MRIIPRLLLPAMLVRCEPDEAATSGVLSLKSGNPITRETYDDDDIEYTWNVQAACDNVRLRSRMIMLAEYENHLTLMLANGNISLPSSEFVLIDTLIPPTFALNLRFAKWSTPTSFGMDWECASTRNNLFGVIRQLKLMEGNQKVWQIDSNCREVKIVSEHLFEDCYGSVLTIDNEEYDYYTLNDLKRSGDKGIFQIVPKSFTVKLSRRRSSQYDDHSFALRWSCHDLSKSRGIHVAFGQQLTSLPLLAKSFRMSFDLMLADLKDGYILRVTRNHGGGFINGDCTPCVSVKHNKLMVRSAINGFNGFKHTVSLEGKDFNQWMRVDIYQRTGKVCQFSFRSFLAGPEAHCFIIRLDGQIVSRIELNLAPNEFRNVAVYTGGTDATQPLANAFIDNFEVEQNLENVLPAAPGQDVTHGRIELYNYYDNHSQNWTVDSECAAVEIVATQTNITNHDTLEVYGTIYTGVSRDEKPFDRRVLPPKFTVQFTSSSYSISQFPIGFVLDWKCIEPPPVKFTQLLIGECSGEWSGWSNIKYQSSAYDYYNFDTKKAPYSYMCQKFAAIQGRIIGSTETQTKELVSFSENGMKCNHAEQFPSNHCADYEFRFCCDANHVQNGCAVLINKNYGKVHDPSERCKDGNDHECEGTDYPWDDAWEDGDRTGQKMGLEQGNFEVPDWRSKVTTVAVHPGCQLEAFNQTFYRQSLGVFEGFPEDNFPANQMRSAKCRCNGESVSISPTISPTTFGGFSEHAESGTFYLEYIFNMHNATSWMIPKTADCPKVRFYPAFFDKNARRSLRIEDFSVLEEYLNYRERFTIVRDTPVLVDYIMPDANQRGKYGPKPKGDNFRIHWSCDLDLLDQGQNLTIIQSPEEPTFTAWEPVGYCRENCMGRQYRYCLIGNCWDHPIGTRRTVKCKGDSCPIPIPPPVIDLFEPVLSGDSGVIETVHPVPIQMTQGSYPRVKDYVYQWSINASCPLLSIELKWNMTSCSVNIGEFSTRNLYSLYGLTKDDDFQEEDMKTTISVPSSYFDEQTVTFTGDFDGQPKSEWGFVLKWKCDRSLDDFDFDEKVENLFTDRRECPTAIRMEGPFVAGIYWLDYWQAGRPIYTSQTSLPQKQIYWDGQWKVGLNKDGKRIDSSIGESESEEKCPPRLWRNDNEQFKSHTFIV